MAITNQNESSPAQTFLAENATLSVQEQVIQNFTITKHDHCTLTTNRIFVAGEGSQESYPLSHISAVKLHRGISWGLIIFGLIFLAVGTSTWAIFEYFHQAIPSSLTSFNWAHWVMFALGGIFIWNGIAGYTVFTFIYTGGEKQFTMQGRNPDVVSFVNAINHRLG